MSQTECLKKAQSTTLFSFILEKGTEGQGFWASLVHNFIICLQVDLLALAEGVFQAKVTR